MGLFNRARDTADRLALREALAEPPAAPVKRRGRSAAPPEKPLKPIRVEFALVKVRPEPLEQALDLVRAVIDVASDTKATVTVLGTAVIVVFAYPVTHRPTDELTQFIQAVQQHGDAVGVVHGIEECMAGTYGGSTLRVFGPVMPNLLTYLKRLAEVGYGIVMRV